MIEIATNILEESYPYRFQFSDFAMDFSKRTSMTYAGACNFLLDKFKSDRRWEAFADRVIIREEHIADRPIIREGIDHADSQG